MSKAIVSYVDTDGIRHSVEVEAGSLYEAAALGMKAFKDHELEPAGLTQLEVEIRTSITHSLTVKQFEQWLAKPGRAPRDIVEKDRLKSLLT